jgi:glycerophosphoryl diester phosphodiesterase
MRYLALVLSLLLVSTARAGDFTAQWWQPVAPLQEPQPVMSIGEKKITLRPVPPAKAKDAPRWGLFLDETRVTQTPIYPGKRYHFAVVSHGGETQWFVNGYPDAATKDALEGEVTSAAGSAIKSEAKALSHEDILNSFKSQLRARDIVTVGHRGVNKYAPENTRISYVQLVETGAPIAEMDLALTKDGEIVLMHDPTVKRTTGKEGKVSDFTADEITKLDAGAWKDKKYAGEKVPRLGEIAEVCRGKTVMMLDLKSEGQGKALAAWLKEHKLTPEQVILAPWTDAEGVALRQYITDVPMIRLTSKVPTDTVNDAYFAHMKHIGFNGFSVNWQYLTQEFVAAAQKNGMKVYVWTVNDPQDIAGSVLLGVDGIITDDPAETMKTIHRLATRS